MTAERKAGLIMAALASALWLFIVVAFAATALAGDGFPFGLGALALFIAAPLSMAASVILLVSLSRTYGVNNALPESDSSRSLRRTAPAVLAVLSLLLLPAAFWLGPYDSVPVGLKWASQLGGIAAFMASHLLFAVLDRRP